MDGFPIPSGQSWRSHLWQTAGFSHVSRFRMPFVQSVRLQFQHFGVFRFVYRLLLVPCCWEPQVISTQSFLSLRPLHVSGLGHVVPSASFCLQVLRFLFLPSETKLLFISFKADDWSLMSPSDSSFIGNSSGGFCNATTWKFWSLIFNLMSPSQ